MDLLDTIKIRFRNRTFVVRLILCLAVLLWIVGISIAIVLWLKGVGEKPAEETSERLYFVQYEDNEVVLRANNSVLIGFINGEFDIKTGDQNKAQALKSLLETYQISKVESIALTDGDQLIRLELNLSTASNLDCQRAVQNNDGQFLTKTDCNVEIERDSILKQLISDLDSLGIFESVSTNGVYSISSAPTDTYYNYQWALDNTGQEYPLGYGSGSDTGIAGEDMEMAEVWDTVSENNTVLVAVLDTGVDFTHPDLDEKIWVNVGELNGFGFQTFTDNGGVDVNSNSKLDCVDILSVSNQGNSNLSILYDKVDSDGNGYVDDFCGWDFESETCEDDLNADGICDADGGEDNYMADVYAPGGHGTGVAGIIAAEHNDIGIAGITQNSKILPLRVGDKSGNVNAWLVLKAMNYAIAQGADVVNMSMAGYWNDSSLREAIVSGYNNNIVLVAGAGNAYGSQGVMGYPARYREVIGVTASDANGNLAPYVDNGSEVDVAGYGHNVLSLMSTQSECWISPTYYCNDLNKTEPYAIVSGTSNATPHASGLAALLRSQNPDWNVEQIRQAIVNGAIDDGSVGFDINYGYGKLNAYNSLSYSSIPYVKIISPIINYNSHVDYSAVSEALVISGISSGADITSWSLDLREDGSTSWLQVGLGASLSQDFTVNLDTTKFVDKLYWLRLAVTSASGVTGQDIIPIFINNTYISGPSANDVFGRTQINITGSINPFNFDHYEVSYLKPDGTMSSDFVNISNPSNPVSNGILATVDSTQFPSGDHGKYTIILKAFYTDSSTETDQLSLVIDTTIAENYPLKSVIFDSDPGGLSYANGKFFLAIEDYLDGREVYAYNFLSGAEIFKYPSLMYTTSRPFYLPSFDFDSDGNEEYVYPYFSFASGNKIDIVKQDGSVFQSIDVNVSPECFSISNEFGSIQVSDLDLNGYPEIIVAACKRLFVFENGVEKPEFAVSADLPTVGGTLATGIASADINSDGKKEIIIAARDGIYVWSSVDQDTSGQIDLLWSYSVSGGFDSQPLVADIDRDSQKEIIAGALNGTLYVFSADGSLFDYESDQHPDWPANNPGSSLGYSSAAVANLDGDSDLEIVTQVPSYSPSGINIYIYNPDGTLVSGWPVFISAAAGYNPFISDSMLITDLDLDNQNELIFIVTGAIYAYNSDGTLVSGWPHYLGKYIDLINPLILVEDGVKKYILVAAKPGIIIAYEFDTISTGTSQWLYHSANVQRNGEFENADPVMPRSDLSVQKSVSSSTTYVGDVVDFSANIINNGRDTSTGITLKDSLPSAFEVVQISSDSGVCTVLNNEITCTWESLAIGNSVGVVIRVRALSSGVSTNAVTVSSVTEDLITSNNSASAEVNVLEKSSDLSMSLSADKTQVFPGGSIIYTLKVRNSGPHEAQSVNVQMLFPSELFIGNITSSNLVCTVTGHQVDCVRGLFPVGQEYNVVIETSVGSEAFIEHVAVGGSVSSSVNDPNSANNAAASQVDLYAARLLQNNSWISSQSKIIAFNEKPGSSSPDYSQFGINLVIDYEYWGVSNYSERLQPYTTSYTPSGYTGCKLEFVNPVSKFTMTVTNNRVSLTPVTLKMEAYDATGVLLFSQNISADYNYLQNIYGIESTQKNIKTVTYTVVSNGPYVLDDLKFE